MKKQSKLLLAGVLLCILLAVLVWIAMYLMGGSSEAPVPAGAGQTSSAQSSGASPAGAAAPTAQSTAAPADYENIATKHAPSVAVVRLAKDGRLWAGSEGQGVGMFDPAIGRWKWFTTTNGLGDNWVYAIATDQQGRTWVGHLDHGVSVYDGSRWTNYDATRGPLSQRIFAIAVCPADGDVWIAGDCGLTRYSVHDDRWSNITRSGGLPSDQAVALAFDNEGNLYLGTQCDGISIASRASGYTQWQTTAGQESMPTTGNGPGLPSNILYDLAVAPDGAVYAATLNGLGIGKNHGRDWSFIRGANWMAKVKSLENPPQSVADWNGATLSDDRCTAVAVDDAGRVYVGHWHHGLDVIDCPKLPATGAVTRINSPAAIRGIEPIGTTGQVALGSFSSGVTTMQTTEGMQAINTASAPAAAPISTPPIPTPASPPTSAQIDSMISQLKSLPPGTAIAEYLGEDWSTHGDWPGRVGGAFAALFGVKSMADTFGDDGAYPINRATGPHHIAGDRALSGFYYIGQEKDRDPSVLFDPRLSIRFFGEWNDGTFNAARYPETWDGPNLGIGITLPAGIHRVSLYFLNQDRARHPYRDYQVELKQGDDQDFAAAYDSPTLARVRVRDFNEGVFKQFIIRGSGQFWFKVDRNGSECTKASAIMVDELTPGSSPPNPAWPAQYQPPSIAESANNTSPTVAKARQLWSALDAAYDRLGGVAAQRPMRILAYRAALAAGADPDLLSNWRRTLGLWTDQEKKDFDSAVIANVPSHK